MPTVVAGSVLNRGCPYRWRVGHHANGSGWSDCYANGSGWRDCYATGSGWRLGKPGMSGRNSYPVVQSGGWRTHGRSDRQHSPTGRTLAYTWRTRGRSNRQHSLTRWNPVRWCGGARWGDQGTAAVAVQNWRSASVLRLRLGRWSGWPTGWLSARCAGRSKGRVLSLRPMSRPKTTED